MQVKKQQVELDVEKQIGSKSEKEYVKAIYCHPAYLIYMQSTSGEGNGNPLQNSSPDNPMEGVAWWAAVHGVTKSQKGQKRLNISSRVHHEKCWAG